MVNALKFRLALLNTRNRILKKTGNTLLQRSFLHEMVVKTNTYLFPFVSCSTQTKFLRRAILSQDLSTRILKKGHLLSQSECSLTHVRNSCQVSIFGCSASTQNEVRTAIKIHLTKNNNELQENLSTWNKINDINEERLMRKKRKLHGKMIPRIY